MPASGTFVYNIAKGRVAEYAQRVKDGSPATARLKVIPLEFTSLEPDETLRDYDTLALLLAGATNEQTTLGRRTLAAADLTVTVDDTTGSGNKVNVDVVNDPTWAAATGNRVGGLCIVYCPDGITPGADSTFIPLTQHSFDVTPDGSTITASINAAGIFSAV